MRERLRLLLAVVLRGPLAARIDGLRLALGSSEIDRTPPHITLVPPFNVAVGDLARVLAVLRAVASATRPFRCGLGPLETFDRPSPVLYLAVDDRPGSLAALTEACRTGHLAPIEPEERPGFVPHVTVLNRSTAAVADAARRALGGFLAELEVSEFSLLRLDESDDPDERRRWVEIADFGFAEPTVRGRGGFEIELSVSRLVDPESLGLLGDLDARADSSGEPWAVTGRTDGTTASVARGTVVGDTVRIDAFAVDPRARGFGVGTRTLERVEAMALEQGAFDVVASVPNATLARYFAGRGYASIEATDASRSLLRKVLVRTI